MNTLIGQNLSKKLIKYAYCCSLRTLSWSFNSIYGF